MPKKQDCVAQALYHAQLTLCPQTVTPSLIANSLPDLPIPYAYLPQIAAHYQLYALELPRALPLHLIDSSAFHIVIIRQPDATFHAITMRYNRFYDPQAQTQLSPETFYGNVVAIYLIQPSLSLESALSLMQSQTCAGSFAHSSLTKWLHAQLPMSQRDFASLIANWLSSRTPDTSGWSYDGASTLRHTDGTKLIIDPKTATITATR